MSMKTEVHLKEGGILVYDLTKGLWEAQNIRPPEKAEYLVAAANFITDEVGYSPSVGEPGHRAALRIAQKFGGTATFPPETFWGSDRVH